MDSCLLLGVSKYSFVVQNDLMHELKTKSGRLNIVRKSEKGKIKTKSAS